jgi:hypothetical protein
LHPQTCFVVNRRASSLLATPRMAALLKGEDEALRPKVEFGNFSEKLG